MQEELEKSVLLVCRILQKHDVRYMLVGGTAVTFNGYYRISSGNQGEPVELPDIDIWYNPTYNNYFQMLNALDELGVDVSEFKNEQAPNPLKSFFKFTLEDFTLDLLPKIKADIRFSEAYNRKETVELEGTEIHFMNYSDLIKDKKLTGRKKDLEDVEHLEKSKKRNKRPRR